MSIYVPSMNKRGSFRRAVQAISDAVEAAALVAAAGANQDIVTFVADGANINTNITVTGITTDDTIQSVVEYDTGVPTDRTSEASITDADTIQLTTTDTTGNKLVVSYYNAA